MGSPSPLAGFSAGRVALVAVHNPRRHPWVIEEAFDEIEAWATASGRSVIYRVCQRRSAPHPATYLGRGKAEQLRLLCQFGRVEGVIVDGRLTLSQRAQLERVLQRPVLDRGAWGEELAGTAVVDRKTRSLHRVSRRARGCLSVVLVGHSGAGKSTLFRALTGGPILPRSHPAGVEGRGSRVITRRLRPLPSGGGSERFITVTDTAGLVPSPDREAWNLPTETLDEVCEADLLLHVVDAALAEAERRRRGVEVALKRLAGTTDTPLIVVGTRYDRLRTPRPHLEDAWRVSGVTGMGSGALVEHLYRMGAAQVASLPVRESSQS
ncbi:MAG: 50S ribosome-binding GTPase [Nitrospirae bacterium]|nr:50S ribosome-binding GTPase [Nitrospirota bacterium]